MRTTLSRERVLVLAAAAAFATISCRRKEAAMPPFSTDPQLREIARPLPTIPKDPLTAATPNPHGLVASMLTKAAATPPSLDWVPGAITPPPAGTIRWARDFAEGYRDAVERNEGMVVLFATPEGSWTERVVASLQSPEVSGLADQAIWIRADPTRETMAKNVCTALGIEHLPTISVLDPDPAMISEEQRIEGYEEPEKLARDLDVPLKRANGKLPKVPTMKPRS